MSASTSLTVADANPRITAIEISIDMSEWIGAELFTSDDIVVTGPVTMGGDPPYPPAQPVSARRGSLARAAETEAAPAGDPLIGAVVAERYRILSLLGRGGMGAVYEVEHTRIGKLLAMKVLAAGVAGSLDAARRFKREALTVSKLESPNTVQVFDFGVSDGLTYLVMERVRGDSLGNVLRDEGPMPFPRLSRIVVQVCSALSEAHRKGIVHRDVKPENIMLVPTGRGDDLVKVLDFGLAKLRDRPGLEDVTSRGMILGTPSYMAPEQIRGEEVDARTDVYAVGALMYRMLTGQPLFAAASPMAVLAKHLHEAPIPPADRAPDRGIPPALSRIVLRAVRKDPRERYQRIEDLQALLVSELRASGASSVDALLDPDRLRAIAEADERAARVTRDELDAYERRLQRTRHGAVVAAVALGGALAGAAVGVLAPREARPAGVEIEPNNNVAEATPLALGRAMTGQIGRRLDASHGDRDYYAFDLPAAHGAVKLSVSALPSMAMCTTLYRSGFGEPVGTYCVGSPGRDLVIPALALDPGRYLVAVMQDVGSAGLVHESISDAYAIRVDGTVPDPAAEIEPNDLLASATPVTPSRPKRAAIGWARDEDVFCAAPGRFTWRLRAGLADGGALEATPFGGGEEGVPVRIQLDDGAAWQSGVIAEGGAARCLRVRLANDADRAPRGVGEPYVVEVVPAM